MSSLSAALTQSRVHRLYTSVSKRPKSVSKSSGGTGAGPISASSPRKLVVDVWRGAAAHGVARKKQGQRLRQMKQNSYLQWQVMCWQSSSCSMMVAHFGQALLEGHSTPSMTLRGHWSRITKRHLLSQHRLPHFSNPEDFYSCKQVQQNPNVFPVTEVQLLHMTRFWFSHGVRENKPHLGQELNSSGWLRKKLRRALASKSEISFRERQAACRMSAKFHFDLHSGQRTSSFPASNSW